MRKFVTSAAIAATAILTAGVATTANAASMLFQFDAADSHFTITNQGSGFCFGCSITPVLDTPFPDLTIAEGDTQGFDFATLDLTGLGVVGNVQISAQLAFTTPDVDPAATTGSAWYATAFGFVSGGQLFWNSIAPITTANGSQFTVSFQDLSGITTSAVTDKVFITVNHVGGVPEPASWALMIGGFGMAGAMLRRRRSLAAAA